MNKKELAKIKEELIRKRDEILNMVKKNIQGGTAEVGDMIDIASDSVEREIMFELNDNERMMLNDINNALKKIEDGTYEKCELCNNKISLDRLKAVPFARYCIKCQEKMEKKK